MAKVTEQDLLDKYEFKLYGQGYYKKDYEHQLLGKVGIFTLDGNIFLEVVGVIASRKPLTHSNLDLFIRFAEGKEL